MLVYQRVFWFHHLYTMADCEPYMVYTMYTMGSTMTCILWVELWLVDYVFHRFINFVMFTVSGIVIRIIAFVWNRVARWLCHHYFEGTENVRTVSNSQPFLFWLVRAMGYLHYPILSANGLSMLGTTTKNMSTKQYTDWAHRWVCLKVWCSSIFEQFLFWTYAN